MIGNKPSCAIVIRAYNEEKYIGRLFEGIEKQTIQNLEIVLVDSGSTDDTLKIAGQYPVKILHIQPKEFTFGRSLNWGIQHTSANLVVIASAHVFPVYPDWLEHLLAPFEDPQIGLTYGKQRGTAETHYSEQRIFERWFPDETCLYQEHPFCNNANAAIRRQLWEQRPYDEKLTGLEDLEWANWMMSTGYNIAYIPEAEIIHVHQETPTKIYNRYRREAMAFKRIFPQERFNFFEFLHLYLTNIFADLSHAKKDKVLLANWLGILWFRLMQFWGTYRGYQKPGPLTWQLRQTFYYPQGIYAENLRSRRQIEPIQYNDIKDQ